MSDHVHELINEDTGSGGAFVWLVMALVFWAGFVVGAVLF